jgi:hypothetical protein
MRSRLFVTVLAAAAVALPTGGCGGSGGRTPAAPTAAASAAGAGPAGSTGASPSAPASPVTVPASALLQPGDLGGAKPDRPTTNDLDHLSPPTPCLGNPYPSDALRLAAAKQRAVVPTRAGSTPVVVFEHVARYRSGGAAQLITELKAAVQRCPGPGGASQRRWKLVRDDGDTLLLHVTRQGGQDGRPVTHTTVVGVARVGDAVVVVADLGWEDGSGTEALVGALLPVALRRAATMS